MRHGHKIDWQDPSETSSSHPISLFVAQEESKASTNKSFKHKKKKRSNPSLVRIMTLGTWWDPYGDTALNNLIFFMFDETATMSCGSEGSRCSFNRNHFTQIDDDCASGSCGIADQLAGSVWATSK